MKVLIVLTSNDRMGDAGEATGFWLEEFATPYYLLKDACADITLASPAGGEPPMDPRSAEDGAQTAATRRFEADAEAGAALANTVQLADLDADRFDAIFYPGGHGPLWDLVSDRDSIALIEAFFAAGKPVAAVCHAPAVLLNAKAPDGEPLVRNRQVTGFSNSEETAVGLADTVPFLLEDALREKGGDYRRADDWQAIAIADGNLITGQNPASSAAVAQALLERLRQRDA